ncbi:MAG TPA: prepilin-type N-terminal cleavage/methylation domain-containing protein [Chthonomonadaceae bacterium]|nr:prepilin-type N-terminal cleavage/methylation domain-containing protein [Chthonomonadaceae bacterium]
MRRRIAGNNDYKRSRGFTLIEILVVMVILLIGILALLRLFPGGFLTIQRTAEMTNAQALVAQQLEAERKLLALPDSVVAAYIDSNGNIQIDPTVTPDDLTDFTSANLPAGIPAGWDPYYYSNINRIRLVKGETFHIPIPTPNNVSGTYGSIYMLQQGPVYNQFGTDSNNNPTDGISVHGASMQRIEYQPAGGSNMMDQPDQNLVGIVNNEAQYAIDYNDGLIAFYPRVAPSSNQIGSRTFVITYSYYIVDSTGSVFVQQPIIGPSTQITVPDVDPATIKPGEQPAPIWQPIFNLDGNHPNSATPPANYTQPQNEKLNTNSFAHETDDVSRKFRLITGQTVLPPPGNTPQFDANDPYEYAWFSAQKETADPSAPIWFHTNAGVLVFNPIGHNQVIQTSAGPQPLTARVDYMTFDNHIIREDRVIPTAPPYDIKLSLPFIHTNGDIMPDNTTYNGMFRDPNMASADLMIYNAATGEEIGEWKLNQPVIPPNEPGDYVNPNNTLNFTLNPQTGVVRLNTTSVQNANLQGATIRFFYRAQKEWGMQVQKASALYSQATAPPLGYNNYYIGGTDSAQDGLAWRLYFPPCDLGKTVVLGKYTINTSNSNQPIETFTGEQFQITNDAPDTLNLPHIDVKTAHPEAISFNDDPRAQAVSNVQGISLKSRVIWVSSSRWRKLDTDTLLFPAQTH